MLFLATSIVYSYIAENFVATKCLDIGTLREITYGMHASEVFDYEKCAVGGCCINGDGSDPEIRCRAREWEGLVP